MPQASSRPAGFHSATPYLIFDGTAADAIAFYRDVFAATELPGRLSNPAGKILDASILIGDYVKIDDPRFNSPVRTKYNFLL